MPAAEPRKFIVRPPGGREVHFVPKILFPGHREPERYALRTMMAFTRRRGAVAVEPRRRRPAVA